MFDQATSTSAKARQILPEGLDELVPGPELARLLEAVDQRQLNGYELVVLIRAVGRQIAHLQARLYADIAELAYTPPGNEHSEADRQQLPDELIVDDVSLALRLTNRASHMHVGLALDLERLPSVMQALSEGRIDLARARVLCDETAELDLEDAREVVESILEEAEELTTGQLGRRLRRRIIKLYPEAAKERYKRGIEDRKVESRINPDGTADLLGRQLPTARVAGIFNRIEAIARHLNRQGDPRSVDQIRADIFMDILEGKSHHRATNRGGVHITVDLATLMGLAEDPGDLEGWGPVVADVARNVVAEQRDGTWEVVVMDPDTGEPIWTGTNRRRPTAAQKRHVEARDRTCLWSTCPVPAYRCHIDHRKEHAMGGPTHTCNLGPLCPHHHLGSKHRAGWKLVRLGPGSYVWISPRGHHYKVRPPPL